jgi:hypothetical protein
MTKRSTSRASALIAVAVFAAAPVAAVGAQSNLSGQGYGYATGQFSTRAQGAAGSIAESDPFTPINPATIAVFPTRILFFQAEPEFRTVKTGPISEHTSTTRYPVVFGALPIWGRFVASLSASTFLDRTSTTAFRSTQLIGAGDSVPMTTTYRIDGGIADVRLAGAMSIRPWLRVGLGAHAITGRNLVDITQEFSDTIRFSSFAQQILIGFSGSAASGGFQLVNPSVSLSAAARLGGNIRASIEDTVLTRAQVPDRYSVAFAYTGITNSVVSIRTAYENWSKMNGLGGPGLVGVNGWDSSIGADLAGPRLSNRVIFIRGGARTRTLPFQAAGKNVKENSFSGGLGTQFANGRVLGDFAVIRALRSADIGATERAWTMSFGISVRP